MNKEQAINLLKKIQEIAYKSGSVAFTPESFNELDKAIIVLSSPPVEKDTKK